MVKRNAMSSRETAELIGVSTRTLARWRQTEGMGPAYIRTVSGQIIYYRGTVLQWMVKHGQN